MRQVARSTCTSSLSLFRYIWVLIKHCTTVWWPTSRFMVAGTSYTYHSQLFSKKNLWNEKVAKEPKSSQIQILEPTASQKSQIYVFWLQKSQSGNPGFLPSTTATRLYSRNNLLLWNRLWRHNQSRLQEEECSSDRLENLIQEESHADGKDEHFATLESSCEPKQMPLRPYLGSPTLVWESTR